MFMEKIRKKDVSPNINFKSFYLQTPKKDNYSKNKKPLPTYFELRNSYRFFRDNPLNTMVMNEIERDTYLARTGQKRK